jgi:hypothetical protein
MAPLPSNNTGVVFVDYNVGGEDHTLQARYSVGNAAPDALVVVQMFLEALDTELLGLTILGARARAKDSNVTLPAVWPGAGSYGSGAASNTQTAWYYDFIGRSAGGRRVRWSMFGAERFEDSTGDDYRLPATDVFGAARDVLVDNADVICAIDGEAPVWYTYVNTGVNAYWRNRVR